MPDAYQPEPPPPPPPPPDEPPPPEPERLPGAVDADDTLEVRLDPRLSVKLPMSRPFQWLPEYQIGGCCTCGRSSRQHRGELGVPLVLAIKRHGIGQITLEQFRRLLRRVQHLEPFFFRRGHVHAEAFELVENRACRILSVPEQVSRRPDCSNPSATAPATRAIETR